MSALSYVKDPPDNNCSICLNSLHGSDDEGTTMQVVAHLNDGELVHHNHKICLLLWLNIRSSCPTCRDPLDARSLLTRVDILTEKLESLWQNLKEAGVGIAESEAIKPGIILASIIGASFFAISLTPRPPPPCEFEWEVPFLLKLRELMGPNCDPAFVTRQVEQFRKLAFRVWDSGWLSKAGFYATFGMGIIPWSLVKELLSRPPLIGPR